MNIEKGPTSRKEREKWGTLVFLFWAWGIFVGSTREMRATRPQKSGLGWDHGLFDQVVALGTLSAKLVPTEPRLQDLLASTNPARTLT